MRRNARERRRLPAWREQKLPAGGTVQPGELHEGQREIRGEPQNEARRPRVWQRRGPLRAEAQSGPVGKGWACGPPPCACCSFIFLICAATLQALLEKATLLAWFALSCASASSGT